MVRADIVPSYSMQSMLTIRGLQVSLVLHSRSNRNGMPAPKQNGATFFLFLPLEGLLCTLCKM